MTRALPEWIGKTADSAVPPRIRVRVFDRYDGLLQRLRMRAQVRCSIVSVRPCCLFLLTLAAQYLLQQTRFDGRCSIETPQRLQALVISVLLMRESREVGA